MCMCQNLWKLAGNRQTYCNNKLAYFFLAHTVYTPCLKKNCANLYFAPCLSNIYRFQWKLEELSWNKPSIKLYLKCPLHLKYVLALPWETWSARLSHQRNNEVHIWMINWIVTNMTGSYCLLSLKKSHVTSHHLYTGCAQNSTISTSASA